MGQRNQKLSLRSTTTCASSSNPTTRCPKRDLKRSSSQVSLLAGFCTVSAFTHSDLQPVKSSKRAVVSVVVSSVVLQIRTSAPRRTVAVSMSASTPLGATAVSVGVVLCCMRTDTTAKKVLHITFFVFCLFE